MESLTKSLPQIIKESAASPLGILALMIIGLAILAFFFFRQAKEKTRIGIFAMLFVGVAALAGAIVRVSNKSPEPGLNPPILGTTASDVKGPDSSEPPPMAGKYPKHLVVPTEDFKTTGASYRILSATLDRVSEDKLELDLLVRYTRGSDWGKSTPNFMEDLFRLFVGDASQAPTKAPNEIVATDSAKDGHVVFEISPAAKTVVLQVGRTGWGIRKIPLDLTATK